MKNFRKRPNSTAVEKDRKRVCLRRKTIFVEYCKKPKKRGQVSGRGVVAFFQTDNPKPSGPPLTSQ